MATSEIEKLERRYAENPHGLTFAPLAEVHRKNGDVPRALELLRIGLELHPNYIPASIVLGRCHQDLGDLPAAEEAFSHVLRLDDENVIALKSLADINERQDKLEDAERWLRRLVSVDRSNDEARQQLQQIEALKQQARKETPPPSGRPRPVEVPQEIAIAEPPPAVEVPAATVALSVPPVSAPLEPLDLTEELAEVAPPEPTSIEPTVTPPDRTEVEVSAPLPGLETAEFEPPKVPPEPLTPLGLEIETEEDVVLRSSGASEFTVPDASQDFMALAAQLNASRPRNPGRRASDRAPERPEPAPPAPVPPLAEPSAPIRSYVAQDTNGQSIAAFFQKLLVARPPGPSASTGSTTAHAGNSGRPHQDGPPEPTDPTVSFDDFFGSSAKGSNPLAAGGSEPGKDDLDQFHSWLQNLKR
jgi:tetratricopeptide repeat protein